MRLILEPIPDHPGCFVLGFDPMIHLTSPSEWNAFVDDVRAWLAERGIAVHGAAYQTVRLTDDQAFETRMRFG